MSNLLPIIVIVGIGIVLVALTRRGVLSQRRAPLTLQSREASGPDRELVLRILRAIRTRNLTAVGAAVLGVVLAVVVHQGFTKAAGLPLVLAPGAAGVLSTLVFLWWPLPHEARSTSLLKHDQICADLTPRTKGMFGPGWGVALPSVLSAITVVGLLLGGIFSSPDERGLYRQLHYVTHSGASIDANSVVTGNLVGYGSSGPFPGWYYGIPVGAVVVLGYMLTMWALNSNVRRPSLRSLELREFDKAVRTHNGYVLSTGFSALLCFQLVPLLAMAAISTYGASYNAIYEVGQRFDAGADIFRDPWLATLGWTMGGLCMLLLIIGVLLLGYLVGWMAAAYGTEVQHQSKGREMPA